MDRRGRGGALPGPRAPPRGRALIRAAAALAAACLAAPPALAAGESPSPAPAGAQREAIERLEALGYVGVGGAAPAQVGVTVHDRKRAQRGFNFYTTGHAPEAVFMDMDGHVLHRWSMPFAEVWPDFESSDDMGPTRHWRRAYLHPNGDVLAIFEGRGILKLDRDSNLLWAVANGAHHDLEVLPDGRIFVLTRSARMMPEIHPDEPILEEFVSELDADGVELERVSLVEVFLDSWLGVYLGGALSGDIFHTNTIEVLDGRFAERSPAFAAGHWLLSMRNAETIAIVDPAEKKLVWSLSGRLPAWAEPARAGPVPTLPWRLQHQPTFLPDGKLLLFDNQGAVDRSRVIELDPLTGVHSWVYEGSDESPFYTALSGSNIRLEGGNTLITESETGRAIEVARDGTIVWEYVNPARPEGAPDRVARIFEMVRLAPDFPVRWLPWNAWLRIRGPVLALAGAALLGAGGALALLLRRLAR